MSGSFFPAPYIPSQNREMNHDSGGLFCEDLIIEIFLWLPLNSLVRFKRLSKRWYFLIKHKDSNFRFKYLSTLSSRKRRIIVGDNDDFHNPIIPGFFFQSLKYYGKPEPPLQFLPNKKYDNNIRQGEGEGEEGNFKIINPFSSLLDKSLHKINQDRNIFIAASANGFLLCSIESRAPVSYYLVNPVTMEWVPLPKLFATLTTPPERIHSNAVGFICNGNYPSLDLVDYTIVIVAFRECILTELLFKLFSSGDNQWREYRLPCMFLERFTMSRHHNPVIVRTGGRIVVYLLVKLTITMITSKSAIVVFDGDNLLQMIETPPNHVEGCVNYIRQFDDGVIDYVRRCGSTDFEFWVLNIESREWCLKHRANLKMITKGFISSYNEVNSRIHGFHPMNPSLIFLTIYGKMVCYNVQTGTMELVYDFSAKNILEDYYHYVYQWPCWPPLF